MHLQTLLGLCRAQPESTEGYPFRPGVLVFKVHGKIFAIVIYVERGPSAAIAVVVRGIAEERALRARMQGTLELIHAQYSSELEAFDGDAAAFERVRPLLEDCLVSEHEGDR